MLFLFKTSRKVHRNKFMLCSLYFSCVPVYASVKGISQAERSTEKQMYSCSALRTFPMCLFTLQCNPLNQPVNKRQAERSSCLDRQKSYALLCSMIEVSTDICSVYQGHGFGWYCTHWPGCTNQPVAVVGLHISIINQWVYPFQNHTYCSLFTEEGSGL